MSKKKMFICASAIALSIGCLLLPSFNNAKETKAASLTYDYNEYNHYQQYWNSDVIYNESITFVEESDRNVYGRLYYDVEEIISIKDYNLENDLNLNLFEISGNKIKLKNKSTPPAEPKWFTYENYMTPEAGLSGNTYLKYVGYTQSSISGTKKYVLHTEDIGIARMHYYVTYKKKSTSKFNGSYPKANVSALSRTIKKLSNNENIRIVFNGDSITTGAMTSGFLNTQRQLHPGSYSSSYATDPMKVNEPIFSDAFKNEIVRRFNYTDSNKITLTNTAVGGTISTWGKDNVAANVTNYNPDLAILGFGTNDGCASTQTPVATYKSNMKAMIDAIRTKNANCDIILIHAIKSNPDSPMHTYMQNQYLAPLQELAASYNGVAVLNMYDFMSELYNKKLPIDMLANNINHPNDWLERQYTAGLLTLLGCYNEDLMTGSGYKTLRSSSIKNPWGAPVIAYDYGDNGVTAKFNTGAAFGHRVTINEKVKLDGLEFNYLGNGSSLAGLQGGFYFSSSNDTKYFNETTTMVFTIHTLLYQGQDRLYVGKNNEYNKDTFLYHDEAMTTQGFGLPNDRTLYMAHNDAPGFTVRFDKIGTNKYKLTLKELVPDTFRQSYDQKWTIVDGRKTFYAYLDTSSLTGLLDNNGYTYLNVFEMTENGTTVETAHIFFNVSDATSVTNASTVIAYNGDEVHEKRLVASNNTVPTPRNPIRNGFAFAGWYKDTSFTTPWNFQTDKVTTGITRLYAKFITTTEDNVNKFVTNYMHQEISTTDNRDTGKCRGANGYYALAKAAFNSLSDDEKNLFITSTNYADYHARLKAWAKANGEVLNGTSFENVNNFNISSLLNSEVFITTAVSLTALLVTAFFIIKKKKA